MNKINIIGIHAFLPIFICHYNYIALIVYVNGVLCHSLFNTKYEILLELYDTLCNIYFIIYCNYYTLWQPYTLNISSVSTLIFILNKYHFPKSSNSNQIIHVFGIQIPFALCLNKYVITSL